jgi:hypothetical protein
MADFPAFRAQLFLPRTANGSFVEPVVLVEGETVEELQTQRQELIDKLLASGAILDHADVPPLHYLKRHKL